jgi:hypothetical protein
MSQDKQQSRKIHHLADQARQQAARSEALRAFVRLYRFSDADVRANSQGKLSEAQRSRIEQRHFENSRLAWIFFGVVSLLGFLGSGAAAVSEGRPLLQMWMGVGFSLACVAVAVWIGIRVSRWKMHKMMRDAVVHTARGALRLEIVSHKPRHYQLVAGGARFDLLQMDYHQLQQSGVHGMSGTVYYTSGYRAILSVELDP